MFSWVELKARSWQLQDLVCSPPPTLCRTNPFPTLGACPKRSPPTTALCSHPGVGRETQLLWTQAPHPHSLGSLCLVTETSALGLTGFSGYWLGPATPNRAWPAQGRAWAGPGKPLTLPFGRWQALRAASTRLRSAGNIWKKLKEQRKAGAKEPDQTWRRKASRSWAEVWGEGEQGRLTFSQESSLRG